MSASVTDINSKLMALKSRNAKIKEVEVAAEKRVTFAEDPQPRRCFPRLATCFPGFSRQRVPTTEVSSSTSSSKLKLSLFGVSKQQRSEATAIEVAMGKVQMRLADLEERARTHRSLALKDKQSGNTHDALRELKKAKSLDRQVETTRVALDALERQLDTLSDIGLQRELATALTSTSKSLKVKTKGLVELADNAVEVTQELADDAEDIQTAFDGLMPSSSSSKIDDEELLAELNEMVGSTAVPDADVHPSASDAQSRVHRPIARKKQCGRAVSGSSDDDLDASSFPSAPTGGVALAADNVGASLPRVGKGNRKLKEEQTGLMSQR